MSDLCLVCGMCCDGTLGLTRVELTPEEAERLRRRVPIVGLKLRLPCAAHDGCRCTTYDDRPAGCERYRCKVLRAVDGGAMALDAGLDLVARARALAAAVRARVPGAGGLWRDLSAYREDTAAWRRANAELLLDAQVLRDLIRRFDETQWREED
jgi:hypothetical protein